ncbi:hypothetical protein DB30_04870 [Enhygromyxa salina]|uniref:Tetratricopeptide repeat protein n=1 Tax=Enhygromyxa salina TaxID=215803 RepID=A0A0C2D825_9BACT|nr:tetratricopeptide repeat protein [Enhygromyxa salina]KIG16152.1 hypothetical protein DB30_04870 [Enhygromyxa salina]
MPKSRATRRGPRDTKQPPQPPDEDFNARIEAWLALDGRVDQLHTLDLRAFIRECADPRYDPGDRLRRLAIHLDERGLTWRPRPLQQWEIFARIYAESERLGPDDPRLFHARALTAVELGWHLEPNDRARPRLMKIATSAVLRGLELDDADADLHYLAGFVCYMDAPSDTARALSHFDRALELEPGDAWAGLYRAHCLHDLEQWTEAVAAYAAIEAADFGEGKAWRRELAREQRGYCLWRSGDQGRACQVFQDVLERREAAVARGEEKYDAPALHSPPWYLAEALSSGDFDAALIERLRAHLETIDELWLLDRVAGASAD